MKKILLLITLCTCLVSCSKDVIISLKGKIVAYSDMNYYVLETNKGKLYEIYAYDMDSMVKYYLAKKQSVRVIIVTNKDLDNPQTLNIEPIK